MFYQRIYFFIKQGIGFEINRIRPDIGLLLLSIIWGVSFPLAKQALRDMSLEMYITIRFWLGCLVLFPFFLKNKSKVTQNLNKKGMLLGLFMFLCMYSQTAGLQYTTAAACISGSASIDPNKSLFGILGFVAIFPTALAFYFQTLWQSRTQATAAAVIYATEPIFAAIFSFLLIGKKQTWLGMFGAALIVCGLLSTEIKW